MSEKTHLTSATEKLIARYGERAADYIEGAAIRRELTYDDYINVETLLSIQQPLTSFHDESTSMIYHQQTELWFRLILHEMKFAIEKLLENKIEKAHEAAKRMN